MTKYWISQAQMERLIALCRTGIIAYLLNDKQQRKRQDILSEILVNQKLLSN